MAITIEQKRTPGGEVRRLRSAVTEEILEYESKGRVFRTDFDPRETGLHCFVSLYAWAQPEGLRIAAEDHAEILDALWLLAPNMGARAILERILDPECYVARRWNYPEGYLLASLNATYIEVLALGRTMRVRYEEKMQPDGQMIAIAAPTTAEWLHPERGPLAERDWTALAPKLRAMTAKQIFMSAYDWKIQC